MAARWLADIVQDLNVGSPMEVGPGRRYKGLFLFLLSIPLSLRGVVRHQDLLLGPAYMPRYIQPILKLGVFRYQEAIYMGFW